jgi:N-acetylglutamate synthase-like GNAT family acetyltransferase
VTDRVEVRRELRPGDYGGIIQHHGRTYASEYGVDESFEAMVAASVTRAAMRGWPGGERDGIWIVERDGEFGGSLALTDEDADTGALRWFVLESALRGRGLGRRLVSELVAKARVVGFERLRLETFSELSAAAHLYRSQGFEVVREETGPRWGRDSITYQYYELELAAAKSVIAAAHSVA